jgi:hypothetical protein
MKAKLKIENSKKELRFKKGKNMCKNASRSGMIIVMDNPPID